MYKTLIQKVIFFLFIFLTSSGYALSQKISLKTNFISWVTLSPNIGAELVFNSHFSFDMNITYIPLIYNEEKFKCFVYQPEFRYWPGRPNARHFIGLGGMYLDNDFKYKYTCYKGNNYAIGPSYGYSFVLSNHWNLEMSLGAGVMYSRQFKYLDGTPIPEELNYKKWHIVPMKCAISFVYIVK